MAQPLLLCFCATIVLSACGGPLGKWELQDNPLADIHDSTGEFVESIIVDGEQFWIERSGAHPAITWPVGPNRNATIGKHFADVVSFGDIDTLKENRYTFVKECEGIVKGGDKYSGPIEWPATLRVLKYSDIETMYPFRDVDMDGKKFRTFIVVASSQKPTSNYAHLIVQRTNKIEELEYCNESVK